MKFIWAAQTLSKGERGAAFFPHNICLHAVHGKETQAPPPPSFFVAEVSPIKCAGSESAGITDSQESADIPAHYFFLIAGRFSRKRRYTVTLFADTFYRRDVVDAAAAAIVEKFPHFPHV